MKRQKIYVSILCVVGLVVGAAGAILLHSLTRMKDSSQSLDADFSYETGKTANDVLERQTDLEPLGDIKDQIQGLEQFQELSLTKNSIKREFAVYSYVAQIAKSDLGPVFESLNNTSLVPSMRVRHELQGALLEKLAISNPQEAMDFAVAHDIPQRSVAMSANASRTIALQFALPPSAPAQISFITTVFSVWAKRDLSDAITHAQNLDEQYRKLALAGILESQADQSLDELRKIALDLGSEQHAIDVYLASFNSEHLDDPELAWDEVSSLATTGSLPHEWVLKNVVLQWYEQEGVSIVDEIQASDASLRVKSDTSRLVLRHAVEDTPDLAFRLALKIPIDMRFGLPYVDDVVRAWANIDPQAAYNMLEEVDDPFLLDILPRTVVGTWAWNDPYYVLDNLENFPPNLHESATASALGAISVKAPLEAAERALEISSRNARSRALSQVLRVWMQQDLEAAVSWVENAGTSDQQRFEIVETLTSWLVSDDPLRAFEIARKETVLDWDDTGLEADIIRSIARSDGVETAVELLAQVREGKTRAVASAHVAETMIRNGDSARALRLGLDLPVSEQEEYFPSITRTWADVDAGSLVESIEKLPSAELRSKVALGLFEAHRVDNYTIAPVDKLTESQVEVLMQYLTDVDRATLDKR